MRMRAFNPRRLGAWGAGASGCGFLVCLLAGCTTVEGGGTEGLREGGEGELLRRVVALEAAAAVGADAEVWYRFGNALFDLGRFDRAAEAYLDAVGLAPDHASAYCNLGLCYRLLGDLPKAVAAYRRSLSIEPDNETTLRNLVTGLEAWGEVEEAVGYLARLAELRPDDVRVYSDLGASFFGLGRFGEAARAFERVVELDPGVAEGRYRLGLCHFYLEDWDGALAAWSTALAHDGENGALRKGLAVVYWRRGEYGRAWAAVAECQKRGVPLDPDFIRRLQEDSGQVGPE